LGSKGKNSLKNSGDLLGYKRAVTAIVPILLLLELPLARLQVQCAEIAQVPQCTLTVFNISRLETGKVIINSGPIGLFNSGYIGPFNLTPGLRSGKNTLHIQFFRAPGRFGRNSLAGWSYGYSISVDDKEIVHGECGFADKVSCTTLSEFPGSLASRSGTAGTNRPVYDSILQFLYFGISGPIPIMRQNGDSEWACLSSMLMSWRLARFVSQSEIARTGGTKYKRLLAAGLPQWRRTGRVSSERIVENWLT
jgi:hypothetical protein